MIMFNKFRTAIAIVLVIALSAFAFTACNKDGGKEGGNTAALTLELNKTTLEIMTGESVKLTAKASRDLNADEKITWASSDTKVATVTNGNVRGVKAGTATITASVGTVSVECSVTVKQRRTMEISAGEATIDLSSENKTVTLTATCSDGGEVTWSSSDETVATVAGGVVTGLKAGSAVITAKREEASATCTVKVIDPAAPVEYDVQRGTSNANVAADPGNWYYFNKTSNGAQIDVVSVKYTYSQAAGAKLEYVMNYCTEFATPKEDGTPVYTENYLRYQPEGEQGTAYTFTCKITCNISGFIAFGNRNNSNELTTVTVEAGKTAEVSFATSIGSNPLNINCCFYGGDAEHPLDTPITITLTEIAFNF